MRNINKKQVPTELGPWLHGLSYKQPDDLDDPKDIIIPNNTNTLKQTYIKLPNILQSQRNSFSNKKSKQMLKISHQSLDIDSPSISQINPKSRYGALNGSLVHTIKNKGTGRQWRSIQLSTTQQETIDNGVLQRKLSRVQMGDSHLNYRVVRENRRKLMNEQCAKKRGLLQVIRQINKGQYMQQFLKRKHKVHQGIDWKQELR